MLPRPTPPIRVALCIGDEALRKRIVRACGFVVVVAAEEAADLMLADRPPDTPAPVIAFARGPTGKAGASGWTSDRAYDIRAVVPSDIDATMLGAVIAVVAAGFDVKPHQAKNRARNATGSWAETTDRAAAESDEIPALTPREREVLALLTEGASNKAIARALSISVHTVKFHVASLSEKLGASGRLEAVAIAIRSGLLMV
jgi:DNA-binding CsgD family transcriptional regulator